MNKRSLLDEIARMAEPPPPLAPRVTRVTWIIDALFTSLDAKPPPVDPHRIDSATCEKCRRDLSLEPGPVCPHCHHPRPARSNLTLTVFEPRCPDCGYNLSGLQDGRCPECNRAFNFELLRHTWALKCGTASKRYFTSRFIFLGGLLASFVIATFASDYLAFTLALSLALLFPILHYYACPSLQIEGGHSLLLAVVPIFISGISISFNDNAGPGQIATIVAAILLSLFSLRAAPLKSALVLATAVSIPLCTVGLVYLIQGLIALSEGDLYTANDLPQNGNWRNAPTKLSLIVGGAFCGVSLLLTAIAGLFSRRILLQLRAVQGRSRRATEPVR